VLADDTPPFDVSNRRPVSLGEVLAEAPQLTRVDRKYLVDRTVLADMLAALPTSYGVLTIAGRHSTTYRSTYFDTADLASCRAHVQQRRRRWKARSRLYVEDGLCRIEVKSRDGRGLTAKSVADSDPSGYGRLGGPEAEFVAACLAERRLSGDVRLLRPTAEVGYRRTTLADTTTDLCRVTLDWQVRCTLDGHTMWLDDGYVLVETKGGLRPGGADRVLSSLGVRPRSFSKYVAAASLLRDDLPDNDVRRMHGRQLHSARLSHDDRVSA
jgi:hypothetical protein